MNDFMYISILQDLVFSDVIKDQHKIPVWIFLKKEIATTQSVSVRIKEQHTFFFWFCIETVIRSLV